MGHTQDREFEGFAGSSLAKGAGRSDLLVAESWQRCLDQYGLIPDKPFHTNVLTRDELQQARDPLTELAESSKPEMERLFSFLSVNKYLVTLTSNKGVTLEFMAADPLRRMSDKLSLRRGAIWLEEQQGTTGVGTCLQTQRPVTILRDEHFATQYRGVTCTVAPIFGDDGVLSGALNVTTPYETNHQTQDLVRRIVELSTKRIQNAMFRKRHADQTLLRVSEFSDFADITLEGLVAIDSNGVITATENCGARDNDHHDFAIAKGQPITKAFGRTLDELIQDHSDEGSVLVPKKRTGNSDLFLKFHLPEGSAELHKSVVYLKDKPTAKTPSQAPNEELEKLEKLCGNDIRMLRNSDIALKVAKLDIPILLLGETGTGKGTFAKAVHDAGPRSNKPFVAINCAAIPENLIESELFGYKGGAFTGADPQGFKGRLLEANGGTLFLDEIGDMPFALQTRLLRVLSECEIVPLGSHQSVSLDVHVVSATLQDLSKLVSEGLFREDLYFRLNGACLQIPPLRERSDVRNIVENIIASECTARDISVAVSDDLMAFLERYFWLGNIRELKNTLSFCIAMCEDGLLKKEHLPPQVQSSSDGSAGSELEPGTTAASSEDREITLQALKREGWNVSAAARLLGVSRATLHRRIKQMGLGRSDA